MSNFNAGKTRITVVPDERSMGRAAQKIVKARALEAADEGKNVVFWLMAAPSALAWYDAFIADCRDDADFARVVRRSHFFQFDDYPIARSDPRFPVTFRHLLEDKVYRRLGDAAPPAENIHPLEIDGSDGDDERLKNYGESLRATLDDPGVHVIEVKGIGMDGHWGFHGRETPLDHPAEMIRVPINRQNRIQQTIDWPQYFPEVTDVPDYAATATVGFFLLAGTIVDLVPQRSKIFSVLASYGNDEVIDSIPSSALKTHGNSYSVLTADAAKGVMAYRETGRLTPEIHAALDEIWKEDEESRMWARSVLSEAHIM